MEAALTYRINWGSLFVVRAETGLCFLMGPDELVAHKSALIAIWGIDLGFIVDKFCV
jgi:hypothetical protein